MSIRDEKPASTDRLAGELYRRVQRERSADLADACRELGADRDQVADAEATLARLGLIRPREPGSSVVIPVSPEMAIVEALWREKEHLERYKAELDGLHRQVAELVERFLPLGTRGNCDVELRILTDRQSVTAYLDTAMALARDEVLSMHTGPLPLQERCERGQELCGRGIRLRTIYPRRLMARAHLARHVDELVGAGYDIRVADTLPARVITFDASRAVLAIDPADPNAGVIAIDGEPLVHFFAAVFEYTWLHATSHRQPHPAGGTAQDPSPEERAVLQMLATGLKDEKIARRLGVSVRTVSRIVGELSRRLDANSRFQAGVRAARLGWTD